VQCVCIYILYINAVFILYIIRRLTHKPFRVCRKLVSCGTTNLCGGFKRAPEENKPQQPYGAGAWGEGHKHAQRCLLRMFQYSVRQCRYFGTRREGPYITTRVYIYIYIYFILYIYIYTGASWKYSEFRERS